MTDDAFWQSLVDAASAPYRRADGHAHRFARAKLGNDRMFRHVLQHGLVPPGAAVLDLGCGQGLFASVLHAALEAAREGRWPAHWAPPPMGAHVTGVDPLAHDIARAQLAVPNGATFIHGDMRRIEPPPCDVALFFDTLHYISRAEQDAVLARVRAALRPGGTLLLRVGDASAPLRFAYGLWIDRFTMLLHGGGFGRLTGRTREGWCATLELLGFEVATLPMNGRKPFANLLIVARLPVTVRPQTSRVEAVTAS
ncbi:SAM-dependent methyltransferase [Piscinibacter koreensis]|uniref:Class I SAM-dependent methyltransferase n=1 Tax=Piscinibacter koreensis TaxID=2742824 RepID=A0A7Y6NJD2_9BURK|nr:class I SAM-dependent methyltransferase [Schlegelella koreensis]NUZ04242.1 class I SAM-dependent methyltransferase [Schlegelella koreensis]